MTSIVDAVFLREEIGDGEVAGVVKSRACYMVFIRPTACQNHRRGDEYTRKSSALVMAQSFQYVCVGE